MGADAKLWLRTVLKGIGQIAFCDRPAQGALILAAIASLSVLAAALALCGAVIGTAAGRWLRLRPENEWREGLSGVNEAIAGLFAAWLFPGNAAGLLAGLALILATLAVNAALRPGFRRLGLPDLSAPTLVAVLGAWAIHAVFDAPFWPTARLPPLTVWTLAPSVFLVGTALWLRSRRGAMTAMALSGAAMLISGYAYALGPIGPVGLWALTVAPVAFAAHAVFMADAWRGAGVAIGSSAAGAGLWLVWVHSPAIEVLPPINIPMLLALWCAVLFCRWRWGRASQIPELWYIAKRIRRARRAGKPVVALTGAGMSTASGIPDYVSGAWFDPHVPVSTYSFSRYVASRRCRRVYWDSCRDFLDVTLAARANAGHAALTELARRGAVTAIVTQNVDNLHQASGADGVIELHGTIHQISCLDCGARHEWPPGRLWQRYDLRCTSCRGLLKPAVIALGQSVPPPAWRAARGAIKGCGVLLIIGSQLAISSAAALVAESRAQGALIVFLNVGPAFAADFVADVVISERVEVVLPALAVLLDAAKVPATRGSPRRAPRVPASPAASELEGAPA